MSGSGQGSWFSERRFSITSPASRVRHNISQILTDVQQVANQNPELLGLINQQLEMITQIASGQVQPNVALPPAPNPSPPAVATSTPLSSHVHGHIHGAREVALNMQPVTETPVRTHSDASSSLGSTASSAISSRQTPPSPETLASLGSPETQHDSLDLDMETTSEEPPDTPPIAHADGAPPTGGDDWRRLVELMQSPEMRVFVGWGFRALPYAALFVSHLLLRHMGALVLLIVLVLAQLATGRLLCRFVSQRSSGRLGDLAKIVAALGAWLALFFTLTLDEELWRVPLLLGTPLVESGWAEGHVDVGSVLWVVLVGDTLASYATLLTKVAIAALPASHFSLRAKARWYQCLEYGGQAWRHWIPVRPWAAYFLASMPLAASSLARLAQTLLFLAFLLTKFLHFLPKLGALSGALSAVARGGALGTWPRPADVRAAAHCSICYSDFQRPIQLPCKHIFCGDCVGEWLERESTCPMCRAKVAQDPRYRDGSTSIMPQIF